MSQSHRSKPSHPSKEQHRPRHSSDSTASKHRSDSGSRHRSDSGHRRKTGEAGPRHKSESATHQRSGSGHRDRAGSDPKQRAGGSSSKQSDGAGPPRQSSRTLSIQRENSGEGADLLKGRYPTKYANHLVQESDGNFFESFTALAWKQENRRRRAQSEDEQEAKKPPPLETSVISRRPENISQQEFEQLYVEVLYTIKHKIGATTGGHLPFIQDLFLYAREAFGVTPEDHARLLAQASESKPPILILDMTVTEARDLEAKDADGFSDPYCMIGIVPGRLYTEVERGSLDNGSSDEEASGKQREGTFKRFSHSFRKRDKKDKSSPKEMIPARYIRTTSVINNTLNPVWSERFRFDLDDVRTDRIHLDIWDHDDEFSVVDAAKKLNEVQGLRGLGRYFKQIAQSARTNKKGNVDDFLGSVDISLQDIPSTGLDEWYDLEGRSSRSNIEGQIHLKLRLATREDKGYSEEDNWNDIQEHEDLVCVFIEYELRKFKGEVYQWTGNLSQAANTILHQHAIQGDITDVQQSMCRWCAYSRKHRVHPFDWSLLLRLLEDLDEKWEPASLNRDEEECLADSFKSFIAYCMSLIGRQRDAYPPANKTAQVRLQFMLRCLTQLYDMNVFRKCCPFQKELGLEILAVLRKSTSEWYERHRNVIKSKSATEDEVIAGLIDLTNILNTDMQKGMQYYNPLYKKFVNLDYFTIVFRVVEKMLCYDVKQGLQEELGDELNKDLQSISFVLPECGGEEDEAGGAGCQSDNFTAQMMGTQLFDLYLALHEFCKCREGLPASERKQLTVTQYYEWYKIPVQKWLNMSKYKAMRRIKKAVDLDKVGQVEGTIKQSTSAVDVACCFGQVIEFWKSIDWPDHLGGKGFVIKITEDLCQGATYYADLIHEKLKAAGYYDEVGQFDVTEQLCRTINDIEQVRRSLKPLPESMKYDIIIEAVEQTQGKKPAEKTSMKMYGTLYAADDNMVRKIKQVVDRVADKMRPDIKKYVFHLCWAPEKVPAEEAITELMNYLDSNLLTLNNNLLRSNFDRILDSIWVEVLEEIQDVLDKEEMLMKKNKKERAKVYWFFNRLYTALGIMVEFFHANDKGLSMAAIRNKHYESLHRQLRLNRAGTDELMQIYFEEKIAEQEATENADFGTLSVRVYYNNDAEILSVEVLSARNVLPLDPNGLSDPFVLIELCPHHIFASQTVQQTQIVKKTLNPTFDESFEFSLSSSLCRLKGSCLLFTVMDHDLITSNDFAGEAFLSLGTIPGVRGEEVSGFSALTPLNLSLTQPKKGIKTRAKGALDALRIRDEDKVAQEFYKKRKQIEAQSQS